MLFSRAGCRRLRPILAMRILPASWRRVREPQASAAAKGQGNASEGSAFASMSGTLSRIVTLAARALNLRVPLAAKVSKKSCLADHLLPIKAPQ